MTMNPRAVITLEIEGMRPSDVERLKSMIHLLIVQGILNLKRGQMVIHFDDQGDIGSIDVTRRWTLAQHRHEQRILATERESAKI